MNSESKERKYSEETVPLLPKVFYILAALSLIGGCVMCVNLWPGDSGEGYSWKIVAYLPSIIWFSAGIVECALFTAIGRVLMYLRVISLNTVTIH